MISGDSIEKIVGEMAEIGTESGTGIEGIEEIEGQDLKIEEMTENGIEGAGQSLETLLWKGSL